jgi:subtilisin-like proprotein convertase family protein
MMMKQVWLLLVTSTFLACGPAARPNGGGDDDDGVTQPDSPPINPPGVEGVPGTCMDGLDNDQDGRTDCSDPDCSGLEGCAVCGEVENPLGQPFALPDGVGESETTNCSTNADCTNAALPNCISGLVKECHASYVSTLNFVGFPQDSTLTDTSKLLEICVTMEHSWIRDLQIEVVPPDGRVFIMHKFLARSGGEVYAGVANDSDSDDNPVPGQGAKYCWTPTATDLWVGGPTGTDPLVNGPTQNVNGSKELVPGNYKTASPWNSLSGVPLNGMWSLRVTDLWPIDNGYVFDWSIKFDPTLVVDCSGPIIQ